MHLHFDVTICGGAALLEVEMFQKQHERCEEMALTPRAVPARMGPRVQRS